MTILLQILTNNVIPLSAMIAAGVIMQRVFSLDIRTLSKLNFYVFSPAIMFRMLYETEISAAMFGRIVLFGLLFMAMQYWISDLVCRVRKASPARRAALRNSVMFYNSANYGIPLNQLVFAGNPYTLSVQVLISMIQSLVPNTYGVYAVNAHKADLRRIGRVVLSLPVIYVIPLALLLRAFGVPIPQALEVPIGYLANAFIGTALLTLGVQLGSMSWRIERETAVDVGLSALLRLAVGPVLAWGLTLLMGFDGLTAAALIVSSAVPSSLSSVLLAVEFDNEKEFSSQAVFFSTLLSVFTVTIVIALVT
ncbi:MAG: transporter [Thermobacillus sp. ZCTH02-B1]|uniref:AEC family transporter n=1 Tax=Thermobacillus sp. ZCTH02-B1 TaxID=1858795 RepID=UPI000B5831C9|nr:AEC family transporter [Thermobacillus sp. ZCTH02-B1]OUM94013.1 MAG: transporter [Thermobacillus sp. ZCTH02-B1]